MRKKAFAILLYGSALFPALHQRDDVFQSTSSSSELFDTSVLLSLQARNVLDILQEREWATAACLIRFSHELIPTPAECQSILPLIEHDVFSSTPAMPRLEDLAFVVCALGKVRDVWPSVQAVFGLAGMLSRSGMEVFNFFPERWQQFNECLFDLFYEWYVPRLHSFLLSRWEKAYEPEDLVCYLGRVFNSYVSVRINLYDSSYNISQAYRKAVEKGNVGAVVAFMHKETIERRKLWDGEDDPLEIAWKREDFLMLDCLSGSGTAANIFPGLSPLDATRAETLKRRIWAPTFNSPVRNKFWEFLSTFISSNSEDWEYRKDLT